MLYTEKFGTKDGIAQFKPSPWPGLPKPVEAQKAKHKFWINNGRNNEIWQTAYHNQYDSHVRGRYPMAYIELNPDDMREMGATPATWSKSSMTTAQRTQWPTR